MKVCVQNTNLVRFVILALMVFPVALVSAVIIYYTAYLVCSRRYEGQGDGLVSALNVI